MTGPVLTGYVAERIAEHLDQLAELAAVMRTPPKPSERQDDDPEEG